MTYIRNVTLAEQGIVSSGNTTTAPLSISGVYTGTGEDVSNYASISVCSTTSPITASGNLYLEFSPDNIIWTLGSGLRQIKIPINELNAVNTIHSLIPISQYFRVRYENLDVAQSGLNIQTMYNRGARVALPTSRLAQNLSNYNDVLNVRSALVGSTDNDEYWQSVGVDNQGSLKVNVSNPTTAFGELLTSEQTPVSQIDFVYGINNVLMSTGVTGSGTVSSSGALGIVETTANASSSATLSSSRYLKYRPGQGGLTKFTALFTTGVADSKQYAGIGDTDLNNGFFFGYNGTSFGICHINNGSETWINQADWNRDICDGSKGSANKSGFNIDPTKGNVYEIKYQYLGFGVIKFGLVNPENGQYFIVHTIEYPNVNTVPSVSNPSFRSIWKAVNTTNATNVSVRGGSAALFVEGKREYLGPKRGLDNSKTAITTETNIITLKNCSTFNSVYNAAQVKIRSLSFGSNTGGSTNGITTLKLTKNATIGGTPSFTAVDGTTADSGVSITGNSVISYDTAGTTVSGGIVEYNSVVAIGTSAAADITDLDVFLSPGDTLTLSISSTQSATVGASTTWSEDF